jgi:tetratricopeptide (TPR) repeat protein
LLGQAFETLGDWEAAADRYRQAVELAPPEERDPERIGHASCLLELGRIDEVIEELSDVDDAKLAPSDRGTLRYVLGRAHLEAGNPNLALDLFARARSAEPEEGASFSLAYATGQALAAVGRFEEAVAALHEAIEAAPAGHRAYAQHEAAYALTESERLSEAESMLEDVVSDPAYPHRADAVADLADVRLKLGEYESAEALAEQALEMGATGTSCLVLGNLAFEYFRLDDAVRWFEQAVSASTAGDGVWLAAHQLLADVYAHKGDAYAERVLRHAAAALEYTDAASEWRLPLEKHVRWARENLGGHDRMLN